MLASPFIFCIGVRSRIDLSVHAVAHSVVKSPANRFNRRSTSNQNELLFAAESRVRSGTFTASMRSSSGQPTMSSLAGGAESD